MKMSAEEFAAWEHKAITLLGMSGVGKTTLSNKLPSSQWFHFSGDYRIGTKYLDEPILDNIKRRTMVDPFLRALLRSDSIYISNNITIHNLEPISAFLGKLGDPRRGGLSCDEFLTRQRLHCNAERNAMRDVPAFIRKARDIYGYNHFVNDTGGSVCELNDPGTLEVLAEHTLIVYIRADEEMEERLIERQAEHPKPLYYEETFFKRMLADYMSKEGVRHENKIDPDRFMQWIFPQLVDHRRPLYQAIADQYGYSVDARDIDRVRDEAGFLALVGAALHESVGAVA